METLKYTKVRQVKSPVRAHEFDAGIDFFVPEDLDVKTIKEKCDMTCCHPDIKYDDRNIVKQIILRPGQSILIPSGIHVKLPHGYAMIYFNKSGVASKKHLQIGACVIDETYQGECHINLMNIGETNTVINAGDKITQGIVFPINYCQAEEINSLKELYIEGISARGVGALGSTGNN